MKNFLIITLAVMATSLAACAQLDVVGKDSARAFEEVLTVISAESEDYEWEIFAPDGGAIFLWNAYGGALNVDLKPFIDAGLDVTKLKDVFENDLGTRWLADGNIETPGDDITTPIDEYKSIVKNKRKLIGYHIALDHYNIDLGGGNMFEWAKDMTTNDKDIVFVLNPEPFINAGASPNAIEGWTFAKVPTDNGEVDKLLKPFDLQ